MIRIFQYYSSGMQSNIKLSYNDGFLCAVEIDEPKEIKEDKAHFIVREEFFLKLCKHHNIAVTEVEREVSFEMFWERYNYKASGRIPALKAWEKLTKAEQISAYDYIPAYLGHLKMSKTAPKYGSSYLNSKIYIK
ncbi:MAG: hypothetical protein JNK73_13060 [Bacteroidia bacterium]|nr:hypothetical protein [Bacteroidia bacterium]